MRTTEIIIDGRRIPLLSLNTLVVGSGTAALNAAVSLHELGARDLALATEAMGAGTSFNAGSDKQTYYKLSLAGPNADSIPDMARDLFAGGCMHGDIALAEAAGSARAFLNLVRLGVPFPQDANGAFPGYKTDHDPRRRATSAGPLTSRLMAEALRRELRRRRIRVFDGHPIIGLLTLPPEEGHPPEIVGALALDERRLKRGGNGLVAFSTVNIILGTGGPAGIYRDSVYPESQTGSHGLAFEAGAIGHNLTEWQYGLASIKFRWNLSGTYQQVIPRYISTDRRGQDEREFLTGHFPDLGRLATAVFLKGYQWPFDPRKVAGYGSSLIDLLVHREIHSLGRRVFLDYTRNPSGAGRQDDFRFDLLSPEARAYLERSQALLATPFERLARMNPPAVEIYRSRGIDLERERLEIAVCAQHNNGGLMGDHWWQSNVRGLFPVGEANGSHGVYRPGGSALNAGQVGSFRAAQFIAACRTGSPLSPAAFLAVAGSGIKAKLETMRAMQSAGDGGARAERSARAELGRRMSSAGAHIRDPQTIGREADAARRQYQKLRRTIGAGTLSDLPRAFRTLDLCLTHWLYLEAAREYLARGGRSRGSFLVLDPAGEKPAPSLGEEWRFAPAQDANGAPAEILEIELAPDGRVIRRWVAPRPLPESDPWFETVWADFREGRIIR
ncbi:MAG: FAD-binding protein [Candidatus Aminicenantes bacterium]|nr:FAD-binding protein [Candidatus Aminicenantes bacterium]